MKTLFACVALVVVLCNILGSDAACDFTKVGGCTTDLTGAAGTDIPKLCAGVATYKTCMTNAGCFDSTAESAINAALGNTKCAGVSITVSVSLILMSVMAAIKNYF